MAVKTKLKQGGGFISASYFTDQSFCAPDWSIWKLWEATVWPCETINALTLTLNLLKHSTWQSTIIIVIYWLVFVTFTLDLSLFTVCIALEKSCLNVLYPCEYALTRWLSYSSAVHTREEERDSWPTSKSQRLCRQTAWNAPKEYIIKILENTFIINNHETPLFSKCHLN